MCLKHERVGVAESEVFIANVMQNDVNLEEMICLMLDVIDSPIPNSPQNFGWTVGRLVDHSERVLTHCGLQIPSPSLCLRGV